MKSNSENTEKGKDTSELGKTKVTKFNPRWKHTCKAEH